MALYLTAREVAQRWSCSSRHVRRLCERGQLRAMQLGFSRWRIAVSEVESYEQRQANTPAPVPNTLGVSTSANQAQEVRAPVTIDVFILPADYAPVFPDLWPLHETKKSASRG